MQVRKFEAKTIKDAIELVKFHMGPDAIILSAKENNKGFGLMGESSVEVTAAVSETKLYNKQMAERKLDSKMKKQFVSSSARVQREFINHQSEAARVTKVLAQTAADAAAATAAAQVAAAALPRRAVTGVRYADIDDSLEAQATTTELNGRNSAPVMAPARHPATASTTTSAPITAVASMAGTSSAANMKIQSLQSEVEQLRQLLQRFQSVPQNFVTLHPGAEDNLPYEFSFVFKKLLDSGVGHQNIVEILKVAQEVLPRENQKKKAFVDAWVIKYFLEHVQVVERPFKSKYHVFLGPTGQGKTSSVVKMACHLIMREKKRVALLSGDHIKVGASDQLKIYSQILNIPCGQITKTSDWQAVDKALKDVDYVLLDTPGVNLRGANDMQTIREILPPNMQGMNVHFVQSALARDTDAFEIADRFKAIGFDDVIFTRLDEAVQHGIIYNFQKKFHVPYHSFGIGNAIPEDFEVATKERVVDLIFSLSKIRKERGNV